MEKVKHYKKEEEKVGIEIRKEMDKKCRLETKKRILENNIGCGISTEKEESTLLKIIKTIFKKEQVIKELQNKLSIIHNSIEYCTRDKNDEIWEMLL